MMTARCNEILSLIGFIEATETDVSIASTAEYSYPTDFEYIRFVQYDGYPLRLISLEQREQEKMGNVMPEVSPPDYYTLWGDKIIIIPTPSVAGKTITIYGDKRHPRIDNLAQLTIDIPAILHWRMCDGVIADMYAKDLNTSFYDRYEEKWNKVHIPAFFRYKMLKKYRGGRPSVVDCDSGYGTDYGTL